MAKTKNQLKPSKVFFERDGYKTPILRKRNGESLEEFVERMSNAGYTNLEKVGYHERPDSNDVHVGDATDCYLCARAERRATKAEEKPSEPQAKSTDDEQSNTDQVDDVPEEDPAPEKPSDDAGTRPEKKVAFEVDKLTVFSDGTWDSSLKGVVLKKKVKKHRKDILSSLSDKDSDAAPELSEGYKSPLEIISESLPGM